MATYVNNRRAIHQGRPATIPAPGNPVFPKPNGGPPVPIPNIAHAPGLANGTATLKIDGNPVSVEGSRFGSIPASPDIIGGIAGQKSGVVGGAAEPTSFSGDTKFESKGSVRSFDTTKSNSMVLNPGFAERVALAMLGDKGKIALKVMDKLPGAIENQIKAAGASLTDPSSLLQPAAMLLGTLIPVVNVFVGGAAMAQSAMEMAELAAEVQELMTPPLTDEKMDQIADVIADGVAAIALGFVLGKIVKRAKTRVKKVAERADNQVNPNATGKILDDVGAGGASGATCELGTCKPVIFATGVKIMNEADFSLPGLLPLEWRRFYRSSDRRPGWLGFGWSTPLSVELALVFDGVHFYDQKGRLVQLPALTAGQSHFNPREKFTLHHHAQPHTQAGEAPRSSHYSIEFTDGLRYEFMRPVPGQWRLPLARMRDRHGNAITVHYPAIETTGIDGLPPRPTGLTASCGRQLYFDWNPQGQLTAVQLAPRVVDGVQQPGGILVRYAYDTEGNDKGDAHANLVATQDTAGGITRYRYQNHLMVSYTTKTGFSHHQAWSRLDAGGRVVRTWTDVPGLLDTRFEYDLGMRVTHVTDALGRRSSYHYNVNHEVVAVTELDGSGRYVRTATQMDAAGNPTATSDALGRSTQFQFDAAGNLVSVTDAAGATSRFKYNQLNLPTEIIDALGHLWRNEYDPQGNLARHIDALGQTTQYHYDERGLPTAIVDALGKTKRLQWDASGQLLAYTDCSGRTTRYEYNLLGHVARTIDALGQTTQYQHDALGRLVGVTQADGSVHRYEYDAADNLVAYTDPLGAVTRYRYNGLDQPIERVDALGHSLQYHYDMVGRLVALQNENAAQYQFHYDLADNLIQEVGFDGRIQRYRYNAAGELTELHERSAHEALDTPYDPAPTAPLPKRTLFQRDVLGRLIAKAYAAEGVHGNEAPTTYTYDRLGRMQLAVNGDAQVSFAYDALSQLVEETQVHLADVQNAADADASTFTFKHQYDALGNRIQSDLPSGKTVQWLYYGSGHLHQLLVDGHVVSDMERDALHREISRSQGQLTSQYQFDPMGRLTAHRVSRNAAMQGLPGTASAQALYDKGRQSSTAGVPAGMAAGTAANALQATLARLPGGQQIQRQFQYDAAGNLSGVADSLRGTTRYAYDALSRIRGAQSGAKGEHTELFAFDPAGNLLNPNQGGAQSSGGVGDRDVVRTNRIHVYQDLRFTYDVHGNVTERLVGWHTAQHYRYSPEHQLLEVTVTRYQDKPAQNPQAPTTVQTTRYRYDALGRRIDKTDAFGRTSFVYDGDLLTAELRGSRLSEYLYEPASFVPLAKLESALGSGSGVDAANKATDSSTADSTAKRERLVNEGKEGKARLKLMLAKKADADTGQTEPAAASAANDEPNPTDNNQPPHKPKTFQLYYYHCDQIGAPQELTNEQGRIVWAAQYKVWGETAPLEFLKTGTDDAAVFSSRSRPLGLAKTSDAQALNLIEQPLRFQGQYFDAETGLHYNRFRYYDPVVGRFVHQDPIGLEGGTNNFIFAPNSTAWIDPLGLATYVIIGEGQATIESYAKEMREKRPCDTFITIKNDWKSINDEALKSGKFNSKEWEQKAVAGNAKWIREQSAKGYGFIDLGTDSAANRSPFYAAEKKALERTKAKVFKPNRCAAGRARDSSKPSQRPKAKGRY